MHVRVNMMAGDPARLSEATRYLEGTVRPHVEAQHGNRGVAYLSNEELGTCVVASYWDSADAMTASEPAVQVSRKEMTELIRGTVTIEHFHVPVFVRRARAEPGAGVRLARVEVSPDNVDAFIDEFRNTAVPNLMEAPGLCSAQLMADRTAGHCLIAVTWRDMDALAASRAPTAAMRANSLAVTHAQLRSVEEYRLGFSSVREGDARSLIERDVEMWNNRDREGMLAATDLHRYEVEMPGGQRLLGREAAEAGWTWIDAFPDNRLETAAIHADARGGVWEGRFTGTHTGTLRGPAGEIPATGKAVNARCCAVYEFDDGKTTSYHLYFDQADLSAQLGIAPGAA